MEPNINRVFLLYSSNNINLLEEENWSSPNLSVTVLIIKDGWKFQNNHGGYNQANAWRTQGIGRSKNYGKQCNFCHKMNHSEDECYSKHGFPPWMKQRYKGNINQMEVQQEPSRSLKDEQINNADNKQVSQSLTGEQV